MTALAGARYSRLAMNGLQITRTRHERDMMFTQVRRQLIQRRLSRARTLVGRFTIPLDRYRRSARWRRASRSAWHQLRRVSVRRISRRAALGMEVVPSRRPVRGEFLGVVLFGYALPLVWVIGIVVDYLRHAR